jgi:small subunit ribosomal protein S20
MANLKSSKKQARQNVKNRNINLARKTAIKTALKKVADALSADDVAKAKELLRDAEAQLARAKGKKLIHKNNASRKISRLAKKVSAQSRSKK